MLDLLSFRAGYGFPSDFTLPVVGLLFSELRQGRPSRSCRGTGRVDGDAARHPAAAPTGRRVALQHLLRHPGRAGGAGLGSAVPRVPGRAAVRAARHGRHRVRGTGRRAAPVHQLLPGRRRGRARAGRPPGRAVEHPAGVPVRRRRPGLDRRRLARLRPDAARRRRRRRPQCAVAGLGAADDHRPADPAQREASTLFLEGQGWGFGGSVDVAATEPWTVPGRYGWVGGTGTAAHITPSTGTVDHPAQPARDDGADPDRADAGLLAVRGRRRAAPARDARPTPERPQHGTPGTAGRPVGVDHTSSGTCRCANAMSISATASTLRRVSVRAPSRMRALARGCSRAARGSRR